VELKFMDLKNTNGSSEASMADKPRVWKSVAMLAVPCLVSAIFTMRDSAAPALTLQKDRPALVFQSYMVHEGPDPVAPQPLLTPYFTFKNKGTEPVTIRELTPACSSCVVPEVTAREIPPGGEGRVMFSIRTRNQAAGPHDYLVTVKYEDPKPREVLLTYKVVLPEKLIEIEPRVLMVMGRISSADRDIITIGDHRADRAESPMKIQSVASSSSLFTAQSAGHSTVDGISRDAIEVTYADSIPVGQHRGVITVLTDDEMYPAIQVPVILGDRKRPADESVSMIPEAGRVVVDASDPAKSTGTTITFTVPAKWTVTHVETFPSQLLGAIAKSEAVAPDRTHVTVQLSLTELPAKGIEQAIVTLHANDGDEAEMVTVPVTLIWRSLPK